MTQGLADRYPPVSSNVAGKFPNEMQVSSWERQLYKWGIQTSAAFYRRIGQMDEFGVVGILVKEGKHIHMEPPKFPVLPKWPFHVPAIQVPPGGKVSSYGISFTISVLILRHHVAGVTEKQSERRKRRHAKHMLSARLDSFQPLRGV